MPRMSHLNLAILAFSSNFRIIEIDLSARFSFSKMLNETVSVIFKHRATENLLQHEIRKNFSGWLIRF